jgi:hypothetical protein
MERRVRWLQTVERSQREAAAGAVAALQRTFAGSGAAGWPAAPRRPSRSPARRKHK